MDALTRGVGYGDDDVIDSEMLYQLGQLQGGSQDLVAIDNRSPAFVALVIDEAPDFQIQVAARLDLFRRQ